MPDVPGGIRNWKFRFKLLSKKLNASNADVICLQEVDKQFVGSFNSFFLFLD